MPPLRLLEHYVSPQGEGPRTGEMTQFIRFAGCNLQCALWPCDTPEAIDPKLYRQEQQKVTPDKIVENAHDLADKYGSYNVCLTGGEPMLQPSDQMEELVEQLSLDFEVEMFSNGTLRYPMSILNSCFVVMDWKLPGSGEQSNVSMRISNFAEMRRSTLAHTVKFTVASLADLNMAKEIYSRYDMSVTWQGDVWIGPVWGQIDPKDVVQYVKDWKLPWRLNIQAHKYIFGDKVRSV